MYSLQYPSSNGGILPNTSSASAGSKIQQFLVILRNDDDERLLDWHSSLYL